MEIVEAILELSKTTYSLPLEEAAKIVSSFIEEHDLEEDLEAFVTDNPRFIHLEPLTDKGYEIMEILSQSDMLQEIEPEEAS